MNNFDIYNKMYLYSESTGVVEVISEQIAAKEISEKNISLFKSDYSDETIGYVISGLKTADIFVSTEDIHTTFKTYVENDKYIISKGMELIHESIGVVEVISEQQRAKIARAKEKVLFKTDYSDETIGYVISEIDGKDTFVSIEDIQLLFTRYFDKARAKVVMDFAAKHIIGDNKGNLIRFKPWINDIYKEPSIHVVFKDKRQSWVLINSKKGYFTWANPKRNYTLERVAVKKELFDEIK